MGRMLKQIIIDQNKKPIGVILPIEAFKKYEEALKKVEPFPLEEDRETKESLEAFLQKEKIEVKDWELFSSLVKNLWQEQREALTKLLQSLKNEGRPFYLEVFPEEGDLPRLYIVFTFAREEGEDKINDFLFKAYQKKEEIAPQNLLWFVSFADVKESV